MKTTLGPQEIRISLYTLCASLLLCTPMDAQAWPARETTPPWYRPDISIFALTIPEPSHSERFAANPDLETPPWDLDQSTPSSWDQVYGKTARQAESDYLDAALSNDIGTVFRGQALYTLHSASGQTQRFGLLGGSQQFQSNSNGLLTTRALADPDNANLNVQGQSLGAYWSLTGEQGWHVDLTASGGRVNGYSRNDQGARQATEGRALTLSVEGGFPIGISENWVVEPQAQVINQRITLDSPNTGNGNASSSDVSAWSGRVGARLKGSYDINGLPVEPYVRTNLWHTVYSSDTLSLDRVDKIISSRNASTVELGLGLVARITPAVSLYLSADYNSVVDDSDMNGIIGSLGVRMRW